MPAMRSRIALMNKDRIMYKITQSHVAGDETTSHTLTQVDREASVLDASKLMRKAGTSQLLVTSQTNGKLVPLGIVTTDDIVTRVLAAELDPAVLTAGDIAWLGMQTSEPGDSSSDNLCRARLENYGTFAIVDGDGLFIGIVVPDELGGARSH
jgi:CBS domain-containing protein